MSKPSLKVLSFKQRVYENVALFLDDPLSLRDLVYAGYKRFRGKTVYHSAEFHRKRNQRLSLDFLSRKHKRHVMHSQHRVNCVNVLNLLVLRLDLNTLECVLVAKNHGIRRPLYVEEIGRLCGISARTAQNCLQSLTLAGYVRRVEDKASKRVDKNNCPQSLHRIFMMPKFFADAECEVSLSRLRDYLRGITKKEARQASTQKEQSVPTNYRSAILEDEKDKSDKQSTEPASKEYGNANIQKMRRRLSGSKPPD